MQEYSFHRPSHRIEGERVYETSFEHRYPAYSSHPAYASHTVHPHAYVAADVLQPRYVFSHGMFSAMVCFQPFSQPLHILPAFPQMAHYSSDCWDAEVETSYGWVECVGLAYRGAYDLTVHSKASKIELNAHEKFPEPRMVEQLKVCMCWCVCVCVSVHACKLACVYICTAALLPAGQRYSTCSSRFACAGVDVCGGAAYWSSSMCACVGVDVCGHSKASLGVRRGRWV